MFLFTIRSEKLVPNTSTVKKKLVILIARMGASNRREKVQMQVDRRCTIILIQPSGVSPRFIYRWSKAPSPLSMFLFIPPLCTKKKQLTARRGQWQKKRKFKFKMKVGKCYDNLTIWSLSKTLRIICWRYDLDPHSLCACLPLCYATKKYKHW